MIRISQIKLNPVKNESEASLTQRVKKKISRLLQINDSDIKALNLSRLSIDARKKNDIVLVISADVSLDNERLFLSNKKFKNISKVSQESYSPKVINEIIDDKDTNRPVIIGFGPAGLFAAHLLAINGMKPIILERGAQVEKRQEIVEKYWKGEGLNSDTNVQFGEGGAGTFSDGKLNTQIKDPSGRIKYVLNTFVKFGADRRIIYEQKPHIGTDVLAEVVKNMRKDILDMGGEVYFDSKVDSIAKIDGDLIKVSCQDKEFISSSVILAIGHSARDTFEMLKHLGLDMSPKDFAVGYRVIHPQRFIDISQYGEKYFDYFEAAPYKLVAKSEDGRGVYSFCMCPGGFVVDSSSEEEGLCVNGMSYFKRDSGYANSAIVSTVSKDDYIKTLSESGIDFDVNDPLVGVRFQQLIENRAYLAGKGRIPVQLFGDYIENKDSEKIPDLEECIKGRYHVGSVRNILPKEIENSFIQGMKAFSKSIDGFDDKSTVVAAVEGRTSSPVRINRNENFQSSISGIYPCGEGAGYAGGITSAAVDGLKVAEAVINEYKR